jgi:transposase
MSLHLSAHSEIPEETKRVAHAAFPKGNRYMLLRDQVGGLFCDASFATLFSTRGQPAEAPGRLALITVLQFVEGLSDREAADAVRSRIDWKYALGLELTDSGFDASVLSEFRARLLEQGAEQQLFDELLETLRQQGLLKARGRQRTDSTHVLGAIRALNRVLCVWEAVRLALNSLATTASDWLTLHLQPAWQDLYGRRADDMRIPKSEAKRQVFVEQIGRDGERLLTAVFAADSPTALRDLAAVETLRRIWIQNFEYRGEHLCWRSNDEVPPARQFIATPYDVEARFSRKNTLQWIGYKVHLTETCDEDGPHFITHVVTAPAPAQDSEAIAVVHRALKDKGLLPETHVVDTGYVEAGLILSSRQHDGVDLLGPTRSDYHWQAKAGQGFAARDFSIDWDAKQATCPAGRTSNSWTPSYDHGDNPVIKIKFSAKDCAGCEHRSKCTRSAKRAPRRTLTIPDHERFVALQEARVREATQEFAQTYAVRAGIEGTLSQATRAFGLRRARYIGQAKTHLQHLLTAAAINLVRWTSWLSDIPLARTRQSPFQRLCTRLARSPA